MRAFAVREFGQAGSVEEMPKPQERDGEVLVRVRAAGVHVIGSSTFLRRMGGRPR